MGILIENLSFHYTGTPVLDQVNLEVKDGDYAILTGENGSGKSTFLKLLLGELKAQEGSITVLRKDLRSFFSRTLPFPFPQVRLSNAGSLFLPGNVPSRKRNTHLSS